MARELKLITWCDGDHDHDEPATVVRTLTVDNCKPVLLDLCEPCDKVVQDMLSLMQQGVLADKAIVGSMTGPRPRVVQSRPSPTRSDSAVSARRKQIEASGQHRTDCAEEDCDYVAPTRSALGQHLKMKHDAKLSDYDWSQ